MAKTKRKKSNLSIQLATRLGDIATDITHRHPHNRAIAVVGVELVPAAELLRERWKTLRAGRTEESELLRTRDEAVAALHQVMATWIGPLSRDLPQLDVGAYGESAHVPLTVINNARALVGEIEAKGERLHYGQEAIAVLEEHIGKADAAFEAAQSARVALQAKQAAAREAAIALQPHLVALRRVLASEFGTHHRDFQLLRAVRVRAELDEELEETLPAQSAVGNVAAPIGAGGSGNGHPAVANGGSR